MDMLLNSFSHVAALPFYQNLLVLIENNQTKLSTLTVHSASIQIQLSVNFLK